MSNAVFPTLPGLTFDVGKAPMFSTAIQQAVSSREMRRANWAHPLYAISLQYEFLRDEHTLNELKTLAGFYLQRQGPFDSFLFQDPDDYFVFNRQFGTGDGSTVAFQLDREFGGFAEPVHHIDATSLVIGVMMWSPYDTDLMWSSDANPMFSQARDYTVGSDFTLSSSGLITFNQPPAAGEPLVWNGQFYHRCRFSDDKLDFKKFMEKLWNLKTCDLIGSLGNKI